MVNEMIKKDQDKQVNKNEKQAIRLNKYISDAGFSSRRKADELIESKRVMVDDKTAVLGMTITTDQVVKIDNKVIISNKKKVYLMLNKPVGVVSTNDPKTKNNIRDFINYPDLIFTIGRLDKDSEGLILLTNDGDIVNKILRAEYGHEKEYFVRVDKKITQDFLSNMAKGVYIYNQVAKKNQLTSPTQTEGVDDYTFKIILRQGLNRQIRRMTEALGYNVVSLKRIRIMDLEIGNLKRGEWRYLTDAELSRIKKMIKLKENTV